MSIPTGQFWLQRAGQLKRRAMSALERLAALSANVVEFARTPTGKSPVATPQMEEKKPDDKIDKSPATSLPKEMEGGCAKKEPAKIRSEKPKAEEAPVTPPHRIRKRRKSMSSPLRPRKRPSVAWVRRRHNKLRRDLSAKTASRKGKQIDSEKNHFRQGCFLKRIIPEKDGFWKE